MPKLTLSDLSSFSQSAVATVNANNTAIVNAVENTLSRDGTIPNTMSADLDLNNKTILNLNGLAMNSTRITGLPAAVASTEPVRKAEHDADMAVVTAFNTNAQTINGYATRAINAADAAEAALDSFDDRYLGSKTSDPTLDNDGNALLTGALYWNSVSNQLKIYNGSSWDFVANGSADFLVKTANGNLSAERVVTDTPSITWDWATAGQAKATRAALTGDISASADSNTTTLATVNANVGTFGSATQAPTITVNGKGLITAASHNTVTPAVGSITGLGTGVATFLATPSSANLASALTDETGTGANVFANTPTLVTPILGTPTSGTLTNCTGLPTAGLVDDAVTFAKIQNITTDRLLGRDTAASGDTEEISLNSTLEFTGAGAIQRAALTGDVTATAGSNATTLVQGSSSFALIADISPAQITVDQNDYNPTGLSTASVLRLSSDASRNITGLAGGADGRIILIHNIGAQNIVLADESASSTAGNRFALSTNTTVGADQSVLLQYDSTSSRWRLIGGTGSGGGGGDVTAAANFGTDNLLIRSDGTLKGVQGSAISVADTTGAMSRTGGIAIEGTNTNDNAAAGYIGEYSETVLDLASAVTFTANVAKTIASITLGVGDWDVDFMAQFSCAASSCTNIIAGLNTTTDTLPSDTTGGLRSVLAVAITDNTTPSIVGLTRRFSNSASTTIYMVGRAGFTGTAVTGYGRIRARRIR